MRFCWATTGRHRRELGGYGADKVIVCDSPLLKDYTTDAYTKVICDAIEEMKPEALLFGATNIGRDLAPRCAPVCTPVCAPTAPTWTSICPSTRTSCGSFHAARGPHREAGTAKIMGKDQFRDLKMTRPAFGGHLMATIICPRFRPAMATVRPGVMKKARRPRTWRSCIPPSS